MKRFLVILVACIPPAIALGEEPSRAKVKSAIESGLARVKAGVTNYPKHRSCFSCHHQAMAVLTLVSARKYGFEVGDDLLKQIVDFSLTTFKDTASIAKGRGVGGESVSVVYALQTFAAAEHPPDETTSALVEYLLVTQREEGHWVSPAERPPTMGSPFTNTALAMLVLKTYSPTDVKGAQELRGRIDTALDKCRTWLLTNKPVSTEDRVFHLMGLVDAAVEQARIDEARNHLLAEQRADGSWSQLSGKEGDAYATATALVALRRAGLDAGQEAYQKGVGYLLSSQEAGGAWVVQTRSRPIQRYFDNGDAGGRSQFISFAATSWAVMALLETMPLADQGSP